MRPDNKISLLQNCIPNKIGTYEIICSMGSGGQGSTYLAMKQGQKMVVKIFFKQISFFKEVQAYKKVNQINSSLFCRMIQYQQEMRVTYETQSIHHNLVSIGASKHFDAIQQFNLSQNPLKSTEVILPFILILQQAPGIPLSSFYVHKMICKQCTKVSLSLSAYIFKQIIQAVKLLSDSNISHRDIKLQNIILLLDGSVKIIDFGVWVQCSYTGDNPATRCYLPPQALRKQQFISERIDLFAAHVTLYRLIANKPPFQKQYHMLKPRQQHWESMKKNLYYIVKKQDHFYRYIIQNLKDDKNQRKNKRETLQFLYNSLNRQIGIQRLKWFEELTPFNIKNIQQEIICHLVCMHKNDKNGLLLNLHHMFSTTFCLQLENRAKNQNQNLFLQLL